MTDPGIIPPLSKPLSKSRKVYAVYMVKDELRTKMAELGVTNAAEIFYHKAKFKYDAPANQEIDKTLAKKAQLSYCETCKHLRPPRSFHCGRCNACVEIHDHHCPWIGVCVGYRNHQSFLGFLFWTAVHAAITCVVSFVLLARNERQKDHAYWYGCTVKAIFLYTAAIGLVLSVFFLS